MQPLRRKRVYWPIIFPLGIVLLGIAYLPFAWRELRADIAAMPSKPLFANVQDLPKLTIGQWDTAVAQLTKAISIQPRHPDHLTMLGRLYLVRGAGLPPGVEQNKFLGTAEVYLRGALRDRPFHKETLSLLDDVASLQPQAAQVTTSTSTSAAKSSVPAKTSVAPEPVSSPSASQPSRPVPKP